MTKTLLLAAGLALGPGAATAQETVLTVTRVPAATLPADTLYVAGSFNEWNPRSPRHALRRTAAGTYQISLPPGLGAVAYKFTRGSWATVETDAQHRPIENRKADLASARGFSHEVRGWNDQGGSAKAVAHTATPQVHLLADSFWMPQLGRTRRVWVYLPLDYARSRRRHSVLYLHDGQNVFDAATSFGGEWGVDETLDRLRAAGQDPAGCIVVAVAHGGAHRADEYIPWRNAEIKAGGQGGPYVDFLARTLKPYVDAHYRTRPDAAHTGIAGSSLGGLISVYAALKYPRVFGRVGVFSPAFWVCHDSLRAFAKTHPAASTARFYFVAGPKESETMLPLMTAWRDELRAAGVPAAQLSFHAPADGEHREWFWQREFPAAYRYLFGAAGQPAAGPSRIAKKKAAAPAGGGLPNR